MPGDLVVSDPAPQGFPRVGVGVPSFGPHASADAIAAVSVAAEVHGEVFGSIRPATSMVEVSRLIDPALLVEIEEDAVVGTEP